MRTRSVITASTPVICRSFSMRNGSFTVQTQTGNPLRVTLIKAVMRATQRAKELAG
jgi:hypothetical protein